MLRTIRNIRHPRPKRQWKTYELLKTSWTYQTREFFDHSTLHGVRYIAEEGRPFCEKFMWFCLTATGGVVTLIIIVSLWEKFQTNPTITGLDTDFHNWEVPFPAITLCSNNPTNDSVVQEYVARTWGINNTDDPKFEYYTDFVKQITLLSYNNLDNITRFVGDSSLPQTNLQDLQFEVVSQCEDVIYDCDWKGTPYNCCDGFFPIFTENGFCYSFNSRHSRGSTLRINEDGTETKPQLIHETDTKWSIVINMANVEENNVRVYIHSSDEIPGVDMAPQHIWNRRINKIFFSLKQTYTTSDVQQLSIKQRHCIFPHEVKLITDNIYSYSACMMECRMKEAKRRCGCVPFFYKTIENFPYCSLNGLGCIAKYTKILQKSLTCPCELGCMNTVYEVEKLNDGIDIEDEPLEIVFVSWPMVHYKMKVLFGWAELLGIISKLGIEDDPLEIGFVSWPMVRYKREVLFGWVELLVSFGGIAGLFLGFSLLSGVEIIYYFTMRACCMVYRNKEELIKLHEEYENRPKPDINLDLTPYFIKDNRITPTKNAVGLTKRPQVFTIPFLN